MVISIVVYYSRLRRIDLISDMLITGKNFANKKKQVKKIPKVPKNKPISVNEPEYITQLDGK